MPRGESLEHRGIVAPLSECECSVRASRISKLGEISGLNPVVVVANLSASGAYNVSLGFDSGRGAV